MLAELLQSRFRGRQAAVLAKWIRATRLWTAQKYGTSSTVHGELARLAEEIKSLRPYAATEATLAAEHLSSAYLGGFLTGEGCFTFCNARPRLIVHLRADDRPLLAAIAQIVGLGSIYDHPPLDRTARSASWQVHRSQDLLPLVHWLDRIPLAGRKRQQYERWRSAAVDAGLAFEHNEEMERAA